MVSLPLLLLFKQFSFHFDFVNKDRIVFYTMTFYVCKFCRSQCQKQMYIQNMRADRLDFSYTYTTSPSSLHFLSTHFLYLFSLAVDLLLRMSVNLISKSLEFFTTLYFSYIYTSLYTQLMWCKYIYTLLSWFTELSAILLFLFFFPQKQCDYYRITCNLFRQQNKQKNGHLP